MMLHSACHSAVNTTVSSPSGRHTCTNHALLLIIQQPNPGTRHTTKTMHAASITPPGQPTCQMLYTDACDAHSAAQTSARGPAKERDTMCVTAMTAAATPNSTAQRPPPCYACLHTCVMAQAICTQLHSLPAAIALRLCQQAWPNEQRHVGAPHTNIPCCGLLYCK